MNLDTIFKTAIVIVDQYIPNLFSVIKEADFRKFIAKGFEHSQIDGRNGTPNMNFLASFFLLIDAHRTGRQSVIIKEFEYFNHLLGEFIKLNPNKKEFRNLVLSAIMNFESEANFVESIGEIGACLKLSENHEFKEYEYSLPNKKTIDLKFKTESGNILLVEVYNIHYYVSKYEGGDSLKEFMDYRLKEKYESKCKGLDNGLKDLIYIFPIVHGINNQIIKDNRELLKNLNSSEEYNCYEPCFFGNIQDTYFSLFSVDQVCNLPSP